MREGYAWRRIGENIDFALGVAATLRGRTEAEEIQLLLEYVPQPPFDCGRPELTDPQLVERVRQRLSVAVHSIQGHAAKA